LQNLLDLIQWDIGTFDAVCRLCAECLFAFDAAETLATVPVSSEPLSFFVAMGAPHKSILQQVVAVVNAQAKINGIFLCF